MVAENAAIAAKPARFGGTGIAFAVLVAVLVLGPLPPLNLYPVDLMRALCLALFACAFNLLIGYGGVVSFGDAVFFGGGPLGAPPPAQRRTLRRPVLRASLKLL